MDNSPPDETVWRFKDHLAMRELENKLTMAGIAYSRHAATVSYFLTANNEPRLDSYEMHVSYTGSLLANGDPEVTKSYIRNRYRVLESPDMNNHWIAEIAGEVIVEDEFYNMVLYANPDRVLSLQQIYFKTSTGHYLVEFNLESKLLVLIGMVHADTVPGMIADMVFPDQMSRSDYLFELFKHNGGPLRS